MERSRSRRRRALGLWARGAGSACVCVDRMEWGWSCYSKGVWVGSDRGWGGRSPGEGRSNRSKGAAITAACGQEEHDQRWHVPGRQGWNVSITSACWLGWWIGLIVDHTPRPSLVKQPPIDWWFFVFWGPRLLCRSRIASQQQRRSSSIHAFLRRLWCGCTQHITFVLTTPTAPNTATPLIKIDRSTPGCPRRPFDRLRGPSLEAPPSRSKSIDPACLWCDTSLTPHPHTCHHHSKARPTPHKHPTNQPTQPSKPTHPTTMRLSFASAAGTGLLLLVLLASSSSALESHGPLLGLRKPRAHYEGRFLEWMEVRATCLSGGDGFGWDWM